VLRATATKPRPIREPQVRVERPAFGAQLRGREEASDLDATLEVPPGFVLDLTHELAEGRIQDRAGQSLVFASPFVLKSSTQIQSYFRARSVVSLWRKSLLWLDTLRCTRATRCFAFSRRRLPGFFRERLF
jgi:hypothetical protein